MNSSESFEIASVGDTRLVPSIPYDQDKRGLLWVWESPQPNEVYVLGVDPTIGISDWTRELRKQSDIQIDNAVVEVIRKGREIKQGTCAPDVQVAEYAAPIDAYQLAKIVNFIGRMYSGNSEEGQALACIEVYPGPGWTTQRELINRFGYTNLPPWLYEDKLISRPSNKLGWYSNRSTRRDLWIHGMRHISARGVKVSSPALIEEMTDCTWDNFLAMTARATFGNHDDRVVALLIALWFAHEWGTELNPPDDDKLVVTGTAWGQNSDMTAEELTSSWNDRVSDLLD